MSSSTKTAKCAILALFAMLLMLAGVPAANAQGCGSAVKISGKITDSAAGALPGAGIHIKGTTRGTTSDLDGRYSISAKVGDVLVFSFTGMVSKEETVGKSDIINVVLEDDALLLGEAVSIGYGKQARSLLTNSITKVTAEEFEHTPQQSALAQLMGKVPGLSLQVTSGQPGASPDFFIRGGTTTSPASDTPLIIIDGIISDGTRGIQDMNPGDIESMEVLKDAASTAIYGARAANGIILVTTKSGKAEKAKVNFKYTVGVDAKPKSLDMCNAEEYIYLTRSMVNIDPNADEANKAKFLEGSYGMSPGNEFGAAGTLDFIDSFLAKYGQDFVADLLENKGWKTMKDPVTGRGLIFMDTNFEDATYVNAMKQEYSLSVNGGNDKATYYASLRHLNQDGIVAGTWYKNYSALMNGSLKVTPTLKIWSKASVNVGDRNTMSNATNSLQRAIFMPPTYRLYYEDGMPAPGEGMSSFRPRAYENYYKTQYSVNTQYRIQFVGGADWDILPGLRFSPSLSYGSTEGITSSFEALNETTGTEIRPASANHQYHGILQADALLTYDKSLGKNNFNAIAGTSYLKKSEFALSGNGSGAPTDLIPTLNATADSTQRTSSTFTNEAMLSYFGRVNYNYGGKYLASVSLRADGSSRFAPNHRWGFFPGASLGWNMHKEGFFKGATKVVNKLKLRASYGQAGNNSLTLAETYGEYGTTNTYLGEVGVINSTLGNADLLWEQTTSYDLGLDIDFFKSRLGIIFDVYDKVTDNRLYDNKLPAQFGYSSIKENYGTIGTKGLELEIHAVPISTRDFSWNVDFNFTFYRTKVLKLPDNGEIKHRTGGNYIYDPVSGENVKVGGFAEGERFGTRYAFHYLGVYQTDEEAALAPYDEQAKGRTKHAGDAIWEDKNNDGYINALDMVFMGYIRPDKLGGLTNSFKYKNFSARIVTDYAMGHVVNNGTLGYSLASIRSNFNVVRTALTDCWRPDNTDAKYPRFSPLSDSSYGARNFTRSAESIGDSTTGQTNTSMFYRKGDFLAIREISVSYNLPENLLRKVKISGLQIFAIANNLGYITAYDGMTPELYLGRDYGFYPRPKEFSAGINLTF
jgi:TonB-linked SusC/RagA family outer membrane protein